MVTHQRTFYSNSLLEDIQSAHSLSVEKLVMFGHIRSSQLIRCNMKLGHDHIVVSCTVSVLSSCPHSTILPHCKQDVWLNWDIL